jgi:tetratricopeptide (TPR) repeat protein
VWIVLLFAASSLRAQQWSQVQSPHFTVITDAGDKRGREVALPFEQVHDAFGVILQKMKVNSPIPVTIIAFRNYKEMSSYCPIYNGKPVVLAGMFQMGEDRDYIIVDLSSESGWHTVYHEYAHLLLHSNVPPVPKWFDEGFAEYFASLRVEKKDLYFGEVSQSQGYVLRQNRWMKSAALFAVGPRSPEYNENSDHRSVFYAESWLVVHYLMDKGKMAEASKFLDDVEDHHVAIPTAFQSDFGMSTDQFDKDLEKYAFGGNQMKYYHQPAPPGLGEGAYTAKPIPATDAEAWMADLHFHEQDHRAQAPEEFEAILKKDPGNAVANRGIAMSELRHSDFDDALMHIKKAVETDPKDAHSHYLYARLLSQRTGFVVDDSDPVRNNDTATIKAEAQAAVAIDPELADAYEILGRAQMTAGDNQAALASLDKAVHLSPQNDGYRLNLANYYRRIRNWDAAKKVLATIANNPNSPMAEIAKRQMESMDEVRERRMNAAQVYKPSVEEAAAPAVAIAPPAPVRFAKGKLLKVDCSVEPGPSSWWMWAASRGRFQQPIASTWWYSGKTQFLAIGTIAR